MMTLRHAIVATTIALVAVPAMAADAPAKKDTSKPAGTIVQAVTLKATVQDVDQKKRTVTLKSEDGKETVTLEVSPEVKNLAQVKKGDVVTVEHVEALGLEVLEKGQAPSAKGASRFVEVAKPGEKPRRVEVNVVELVATIDAIDYKARTATLKGPEGKTRTIKVGPEAKRFDNAKKGDQVLVQLMTATAVSVTKAEKKK